VPCSNRAIRNVKGRRIIVGFRTQKGRGSPTRAGSPANFQAPTTISPVRRVPWNKGKLVGAKPPLRPSHVWSSRTKLQIEGRKRDLALFNLAIDSKLRGCDVVAVRFAHVASSGYSMDRATVRQKKTGRPVRFELTEHTRLALDDYLRGGGPIVWAVSVRWSRG
jgi:hypothetical protein